MTVTEPPAWPSFAGEVNDGQAGCTVRFCSMYGCTGRIAEPPGFEAGTFSAFRVSSKDPTGRLLTEYWYASEVKWFVKQRRFLSYGMDERELVEFKLAGPRVPAP